MAPLLLNGAYFSPMLEQVRDFPLWCQFVPDAVGIDFLELCCVLSGKYHIAWMNDLPNESRRIRPFLPVDKARGQPGIARQQSRPFQGVFGRLIFQIRIHYLNQLRGSLRFWLSEIEIHDG